MLGPPYLIVISFFYPPVQEAESFLCAKVVHGLQEHFSMEIVALDDRNSHFFPHDSTLLSAFSNVTSSHSFTISRLPPPVRNHRLFRKLRGAWWRFVGDPFVTDPLFSGWGHRVSRYLRRRIPELKQKGRRVQLMTWSNPVIVHAVGASLVREFQLPWVAHLSDPWTDNPYSKIDKPWGQHLNRKAELAMLKEANAIVLTNDIALDRFTKKWDAQEQKIAQSKCQVIPHSYLPSLYNVDARIQLPTLPTDRFNLVHLGAFYGIRTPLPLLEAMSNLLARNELSEMILLHLVGMIDPTILQTIQTEYADLTSFLRIHESVSYLASLHLMKGADVLVAIDAPTEEPSPFLPSKLVDYWGSDCPIWGISTKEGVTDHFLRDTGHYFSEVRDVASIEHTLNHLSENTAPPRDPQDQYHNKQVVKRYKEIISG